ncbi:hypothetical protein ANCDUO_23256, partial [Ancylostoma duodenale]
MFTDPPIMLHSIQTIPNSSLSPCRPDKAEGLMHQPPWVLPHLPLLGGYQSGSVMRNDTAPKSIASYKSRKSVTSLQPAELVTTCIPRFDHRDKMLHLLEGRAEWPHDPEYLNSNVEMHVARTRRRNKISCVYVRPAPNAYFTLLFSHGNAVDIGQMTSFYWGLGHRLGCN